MDPLFPPFQEFSASKRNTSDILPEIKYELVFDENLDSNKLQKIKALTVDDAISIYDNIYEYLVEIEDEEYESESDKEVE